MSAAKTKAVADKRDGDFTERERQIREALFAVFYENDWKLTYERPDVSDGDMERWKFVDFVIDKLRELQKSEA